MTVLNVPGMHCDNCVKRITDGLNAAGLTFTVSLDDKTVTVDGCENCLKTAISELDDLGFEATVK